MDFMKMFSRAWRIVSLDRPAVAETGEDESALMPALVAVIVLSLLSGVVSSLLGAFLSSMTGQPPTGMALSIGMSVGFAVFGLFVGSGIMHLVAGMVFSGQGSYLGLVRNVAHSTVLMSLIGFIPCCGAFIGLIWGLVVAVVIVQEWYKLTLGKAIAAVAVYFVVVLIVVGITVALTMAGAMAGGALAS
ncbi:MAG: hypothetical protein HC882_03965 [Acidobacteria bacterium]|nr:hypothetical protein [Acidobacteriota bacterium]